MATSSIEQKPFTISFSKNAELFKFNNQWDHRRHYQAVFNSQWQLLPEYFKNIHSWAMIADWRKWLVQVPESERLCVRCVDHFVAKGLTHYAIVSDEHPVAKWQANKVKEANPSIEIKIFENFDDSIAWLATCGFDTDFTEVDFEQNWLNQSKSFKQVLNDLNVKSDRFQV